MRKEYKVKPNKKQMHALRKYWKLMQNVESVFYNNIRNLEEQMQKETGIESVEYFSCDGEYVGIGNGSRTMCLIQRDELEK